MEVVSHRGAGCLEPENTLCAIRKGIGLGADSVEIDVRATKDGKLVLMHDATLERTTNGSGKISEKTFDELKEFDACKGEKIPLLSEALAEVKAAGAKIEVEIKALGIEEAVVREIEDAGIENDALVISFFYDSLLKCKSINCSLRTGVILFARPVSLLPILKDAKADVLHTHLDYVTKDIVGGLLKEGISVRCGAVNTAESVSLAKSFGLEAVTTDSPDKIIPLVKG